MSVITISERVSKQSLACFDRALASDRRMKLNQEVQRLLSLIDAPEDYIHAFSCPWKVCLKDHTGLLVRSLRRGDEVYLEEFGGQLSQLSRELFAPYPWAHRESARDAFRSAIDRSINGTDSAYLMFFKGKPIAHFVLWGTSSIREFGGSILNIPTLGVAVADTMQGKGVGRRCVRFLQLVAHKFRSDAVELTTAKKNTRAANLYLSCEFQEIGVLRIPLGVDPSMVPSDFKNVYSWRDERHMTYVLNKKRSHIVRKYLLWKEQEYASEPVSAAVA
ncbi:MAG: GNAT family N-acetyltransferase [Deltaproteobacteria bacterium]|nr:GNAT family N-acetyltransferase [Deltaproteobacteria bacterium]